MLKNENISIFAFASVNHLTHYLSIFLQMNL
jgi:hypothetical protein